MKKSICLKSVFVAGIFSVLLTSCSTVAGIFGYGDGPDIAKMGKVAVATASGVENISKQVEGVTPEFEYLIGRSAAGNIIHSNNMINDSRVIDYLNKICYALVANSDMPYLYKGYCVGVMDTSDVNAISTPGGHIFISDELLKCADSEDAIAAVIAHEISHIQLGHTRKIIEGQRNADAAGSIIAIILAGTVDNFSLEDIATLNDLSNSFIADLIKNGYSRDQEFEADKNALKLMKGAGYNPYALINMLKSIEKSSNLLDGWFSTHPAPKDRIKKIEKELKNSNYKKVDMLPRSDRFKEFKAIL